MSKQRVIEVLIASAGFACALFLFLPLVVYLLNPGSVSTPKVTILLCGGLMAAVMASALALLSLMPGIGRWVLAACQIGLLLSVFLTVFPNRTGELSGFGNLLPSGFDLLATTKLLVSMGFGTWLAWRKPQILLQSSRYAFVVVLLITGYAAVGRLSAADKSELSAIANAIQGRSVSLNAFSQLGATQNVIVVIFDCFTGYRMKEILREYPKLREDLSGFVYYPNAIASAISTPAGSSAIITGDLKISLSDADEVARNRDSLKNSFLADAQRLGLSTGFISHLGASDVDIPSTPEKTFFNQQPLSLVNRLPAYLGFFSTSLPRIVPKALNDIISTLVENVSASSQRVADTDWDLLQSLQGEMDRRPQSSKMAINYFIEKLHLAKTKGSVIVFHSMLTHPPYNLTSDGKYQMAKEKNEREKRGYETSVYATFELARLCKKLSSLGVYDSTLLIVAADHGEIPIKDKTMGGVLKYPLPESKHFNPLLMVKAPGAVGPCRDSVMSVWLGDVAATVRDFIGVQDNATPLFATHSLLKPEVPKRKLNVPIFFRQDQQNYYASLSKWIRQDVSGDFSDYANFFATKPENMIEGKAKITLFSGVDQLWTQIGKGGWGKKGVQKRAAIEANGRLIAKLEKPGIVVITKGKNGYETQQFLDMNAGAEFLQKIPPDMDMLAVGLDIPARIASKLFVEASGSSEEKGAVGFVVVSGPSYGLKRKVIVGNEDISLNADWKSGKE